MQNQRTKQIRLIHTSDVHLGESSFASANSIVDRSQLVLKALVDLTIQVKASLVIIAGDLFDSNRVDVAVAELAVGELRRTNVPVVILPGNHDCLVPDSIYLHKFFLGLSPDVHVFTALAGEKFSFPELDLGIWGKPINAYGGTVRPLAGIPSRGKEQWQVAVAHGYYVAKSVERTYSFQISEDEIIQSHYDYIALGHMPDFRCVNSNPVRAYYSGSATETGTVAVVNLIEHGVVQVESHSLPV